MKFIDLVLGGMLIVSFSSCVVVQKRYIHNTPPALIPMLKEKGQGFVSGYFHSNEEEDNITPGSGVVGQAGYAFSKNLAAIGGYNFISHKSGYTGAEAEPFDESHIKYKRNEFTLALNYFPKGNKKNSSFNLVAGITSGKLKIDDAGQNGSAFYQRHFYTNSFFFFIQPGLNLYPGKVFSIGLAPKLGYVSYSGSNTTYTSQVTDQLGLAKASSFMSAEFGMKLTFGPEAVPVTFDLQMNYSIIAPPGIYIRNADYSLGVTYKFGGSKKKK
jgi:hypothetical protein